MVCREEQRHMEEQYNSLRKGGGPRKRETLYFYPVCKKLSHVKKELRVLMCKLILDGLTPFT